MRLGGEDEEEVVLLSGDEKEEDRVNEDGSVMIVDLFGDNGSFKRSS